MTAPLAFYEDVVVGTTTPLGSHSYAREEMLAFAAEFDPQRFHLDEEEAAKTHFGRLSASGWQTTALWARRYIGHLNAARAAAEAAGLKIPRTGISPGVKNLKWLRPVFVGDTIAFDTTVTGKRVSASRPDFGIVMTHNTGVNQAGVTVFQFDSAMFLERRSAGA